MDMTLLPSGMNRIVDEVQRELKTLHANDPVNMEKAQREMANLGEIIESIHTYHGTGLDVSEPEAHVTNAADALDNIWRDDSPEEARELIESAQRELQAFSVPFSDTDADIALNGLREKRDAQLANDFFEELDRVDDERKR